MHVIPPPMTNMSTLTSLRVAESATRDRIIWSTLLKSFSYDCDSALLVESATGPGAVGVESLLLISWITDERGGTARGGTRLPAS